MGPPGLNAHNEVAHRLHCDRLRFEPIVIEAHVHADELARLCVPKRCSRAATVDRAVVHEPSALQLRLERMLGLGYHLAHSTFASRRCLARRCPTQKTLPFDVAEERQMRMCGYGGGGAVGFGAAKGILLVTHPNALSERCRPARRGKKQHGAHRR